MTSKTHNCVVFHITLWWTSPIISIWVLRGARHVTTIPSMWEWKKIYVLAELETRDFHPTKQVATSRCHSSLFNAGFIGIVTVIWRGVGSDCSTLRKTLWIKPTDALNSNFIGITTLRVSGSLSAHHQEFLAVHRLWYILCSCDDRLLPGAGWNCYMFRAAFLPIIRSS